MRATQRVITAIAIGSILLAAYLTGGILCIDLSYHDGPCGQGTAASATFLSLIPLTEEALTSRLAVASLDPRQEVTYSIDYQGRHRFAVSFQEELSPVGSPVVVTIPLSLPWSQANLVRTRQFTTRPQPEIIGPPHKYVGTQQTIELQFNTMMDPRSVARALSVDFAFTLEPKSVNLTAAPFTDTSTWLLTPKTPLEHESKYRLRLDASARTTQGETLGQSIAWELSTVPPLGITSVTPKDNSMGCPLETMVRVEATRPLEHCEIKIADQAHLAMLQGNAAIFVPKNLLLPNREYQMEIYAIDEYEEEATKTITFHTEDFGDAIWVDVSLWEPHSVRVYRGSTLLKEMIGSGGKESDPTPLGRYRINGRGFAFFSQRYQEGAYYWVRFLGNYLFHSVPFGPDGNFLTTEAEKLGQPASHGCVRLPSRGRQVVLPDRSRRGLGDYPWTATHNELHLLPRRSSHLYGRPTSHR